jgi:hypothetical protein
VTVTALDALQECYRCGYDLRGIDDAQPCPECGLLAERSRRATDELHDTRPRWLRRISLGVWLILLAILIAIGWPFFMAWVVIAMLRGMGPTVFAANSTWLLALYPFLGWDFAALLLIAGALLLTVAEGYPAADSADARLRALLRAAAFVPLLALILVQVDQWWNAALSYNGWRWLQITAVVLATLGCAPLPLLLFLHLRGLAKRARSAHLAEHCVIVGIGASLALVYLPAVLLLFEKAEDWGLGSNWVNHSPVSLILLLLIFLAAFLFVLWSLYLLIRFAIAFSKAHRQLKRKWARADRAGA